MTMKKIERGFVSLIFLIQIIIAFITANYNPIRKGYIINLKPFLVVIVMVID